MDFSFLRVVYTYFDERMVTIMTDKEIRELCNKLEDSYSDGGYVSIATLFNRALNEGKISVEVRDKAREYYGRLWNYVGD